MENRDARKISKKQEKIFGDSKNELLHDYKGNRYLITNTFYEEQLRQRKNSPEKEIELIAAKQLMLSNLQQLTNKQKQVIIRTMEKKTLRQIGEEMGISHIAVNQHLQAARKKLAGLINKTKEILKEK